MVTGLYLPIVVTIELNVVHKVRWEQLVGFDDKTFKKGKRHFVKAGLIWTSSN